MAENQVIVVGAGASGMMAAIAAAREGAKVCLLEAMDRAGKKLLLTGNGRCNLTNTEKELAGRYHGSGSFLAKGITRTFDAEKTLAFFESIGLLTLEKNGYVYPYSGQSCAVLDVLLQELSRLGVKLKLNEKVESVGYKDKAYRVKTATWEYTADAVILACGSKAAPATGSDGSGYALAKMLGHTIEQVTPALVPVECRGDFFGQVSGVRTQAGVSLVFTDHAGERLLGFERGELQWTKYGVSGIVVFQLSRFVREYIKKGRLSFHLDLLPDFSKTYLAAYLCGRVKMTAGSRASDAKVGSLLSGMLHEKLIPVILQSAGISKKLPAKSLSKAQAEQLVARIKDFELEVKDTKGFDVAQVCAGGVSAAELDGHTLESRKHQGLFFTGEIVDVDGPCGGYNLQWAWSSGQIAGRAAAKRVSLAKEEL